MILNYVILTIGMKYTMQSIQASRINSRVFGYLYSDDGYPENTLCFVVIYFSLGLANYGPPYITRTETQGVRTTEKPKRRN